MRRAARTWCGAWHAVAQNQPACQSWQHARAWSQTLHPVPRTLSGFASGENSEVSPLLRHVQAKIQMRGGPITLAEFMQEALTSPQGGFYMHRDVFGRGGDFITSPEISQMFGEMVGVWCAHTWQQMGQPAHLALVELGPGRGTLMADLLRATRKMKAFSSALELHLVEVSPALRQLQWQALQCTPSKLSNTAGVVLADDPSPTEATCGINSAPVTWHTVMDTVPRTLPALFVAHEFFDALPVHQFVKDPKRGWLEKLVDTDTDQAPSQSPISSEGMGSTSAEAVQLTETLGKLMKAFDQQGSAHRSGAGPGPGPGPGPGGLSSSHPAIIGGSSSSSSSSSRDTSSISSKGRDHLITSSTKETHSSGGVRSNSSDSSGGVRSNSSDSSDSSNLSCSSSSSNISAGGVSSGGALRLVLSPSTTPAATLLVQRRLAGLPPAMADSCEALEIGAHSMALAEGLALRIGRQGGAALIIDYGKDGPYTDSLMAIKGHQGVQVLDDPGTADLSAWVDFGALRQAAEGSGAPVVVHGTVSQGSFLMHLGIQQRLQQLLKNASPTEADTLVAGYSRLVDEQTEAGMGRTYQVMAITQKDLAEPAGFEGQQADAAAAAEAAPPTASRP